MYPIEYPATVVVLGIGREGKGGREGGRGGGGGRERGREGGRERGMHTVYYRSSRGTDLELSGLQRTMAIRG